MEQFRNEAGPSKQPANDEVIEISSDDDSIIEVEVIHRPKDPLHFMKDYDKCYLSALLQKERDMTVVRMNSPQRNYRGFLILKIKSAAVELNLGNLVLHMAVNLLDRFMDKYDIHPDRLLLIASVSLFISAKYDLEGWKMPTFLEICCITGCEHINRADLIRMECSILRNVKWVMSTPNVVTFVSFFRNYCLLPEDVEIWRVNYPKWYPGQPFTETKLYENLDSMLDHYVGVTLQDVTLTQIPPSMLASACVAGVRVCLGLKKHWTEEMSTITGHSLKEVEPLALRLTKMVNTQDSRRKRNKSSQRHNYDDDDQGYYTGSSPESNIGKRRKTDDID